MLRQDFNEGWMVGAGTDVWAVLASQDPERTVTLPYDCMLELGRDPQAPSGSAKGYFPELSIALEKKFTVPESWRDRAVYLEFEGVYANSSVLLNGNRAGGCPHGYTDFLVRADSFLRFGEENRVKVIARTARDSRWYSGAGLYREVKLLVAHLTHIVPDSYRVRTPEVDGEGALVELSMEIVNEEHRPRCLAAVTEITDPNGATVARGDVSVTVAGGERETIRQRLYVADAHRWDLDDPYLYQVHTSLYQVEAPGLSPVEGALLLDEDQTSFGVRTLQLDPRHGLRINGKTVKLRGACVHHDNGVLGAAAIYRAEERRVQLLKQAGFNAVRSAHNPCSKAFLDACDRFGMVVMDELTDVWGVGKTVEDFSALFPLCWQQLCDRMVAKDYNHPSVVFYSIGNEIPETGTSQGAHMARALAERLRQQDESRYIVNALNAFLSVMPWIKEGLEGKLGAEINETLSQLGDSMEAYMDLELVTQHTKENLDVLDVSGYNYATGRYQLDGELFPNRVLMGSETFPKRIARNWREIQKYPHAIGDFTWTGWDYLGEAGLGKMEYLQDGGDTVLAGSYPWRIGWCGDLDILGHRRPVSFYREIVFGLRKEPYLAVEPPAKYGKTLAFDSLWNFIDGESSWTWPGWEGKPCRVHVFGDGDRFQLFANGEKLAQGELQEFRGSADLPYTPGTLEVLVFQGETLQGKHSLQTAVGPVSLQVEADKTVLSADSRDLAFLEICLVDAKGVVNTAVSKEVEVKVTGAGYLAGMGSADPKSEESYLSPRHRFFGGCALAVIRPKGEGTIQVEISAEGCATQTLRLQAVHPESLR